MSSRHLQRLFDSLRSTLESLPGHVRSRFIERAIPPSLRARALTVLETLTSEDRANAETIGEPGSDAEAEPLPFESIDEFRLLQKLGSGGMGAVYLAEDTSLERFVALKTIAAHRSLSARALRQMQQEAIAVAQLRHPSIVPVHLVRTDGEVAYLIMDYVPGGTLGDLLDDLRRNGQAPKSHAEFVAICRQLAQIAEALHHVHGRQIVHRDVKPANILIDAEGEPFLTDFGVAKSFDDATVTSAGQLTGTIPYMSPEQAEGRSDLDRRSDVFSMGVLLYECLTLARPFDGLTVTDTLQRVIRAAPRSVRERNLAVPKDLAIVCHMALEREPERRYQTAAHLAGDLRCVIEGRPITGRPPSLARRVREWARVNRVKVMTASLLVLATLAAGLTALELERRRARTVRVALDGEQGLPISYRPIDADTLLPGPAVDGGSLPFDRRLPPGQYLFRATDDTGAYAESSVIALRGGTIVEHDMPDLEKMPSNRGLAADPTTGTPMVLVPAGPCRFGQPDTTGRWGEQQLDLPAFWIDRSEVSNADYRRFVEATGAAEPLTWTLDGYDADTLADRPVAGVSWGEARTYARWRGARLPSVHEWECAMRAPDGRLLPWADRRPEFPPMTLEDGARVTAAVAQWAFDEYREHTFDVGTRPELASELGVLHGATNVREFTDTVLFGRSTQIVVKGGSWIDLPDYFNLTALRTLPLIDRGEDTRPVYPRSIRVGFRCVRSADPLGVSSVAWRRLGGEHDARGKDVALPGPD